MRTSALAERGQALLAVLLVMVVGLTIGLSLSSRSVTDIKISSQLEKSAQAFSAAEAGIEAYLKGETAPPSPVTIGNATYTFATSVAGGTSNPLPLGKIGVADTYTIWLIWHKSDGSLDFPAPYTNAPYAGSSIDVCWQKTSSVPTDPEPAMEITAVYKDGTTYKVQRGAYDPSSRSNNFAATDSGVNCGGGFGYGKRVPLPAGILIALRLRPFYAEADVGIAPQTGITLPSQGLNITSTGTAGETTRKVSVIQSYPALPAIFDYVLFSGTGVSK